MLQIQDVSCNLTAPPTAVDGNCLTATTQPTSPEIISKSIGKLITITITIGKLITITASLQTFSAELY